MLVRLCKLKYAQQDFTERKVLVYMSRPVSTRPPVRIVWDTVVDGRHRCECAMRLGEQWVEGLPVEGASIDPEIIIQGSVK